MLQTDVIVLTIEGYKNEATWMLSKIYHQLKKKEC